MIFKGPPKYQRQRTDNLIQACGWFMKWKYGGIGDVFHLNWLLVEKRIDFEIMEIAFNGLN